jgi:hypothetical protein
MMDVQPKVFGSTVARVVPALQVPEELQEPVNGAASPAAHTNGTAHADGAHAPNGYRNGTHGANGIRAKREPDSSLAGATPFTNGTHGPRPEISDSRDAYESLLEELEQERLERSLDRRGFIAESARWMEEKEQLAEEHQQLLLERQVLLQERRQLATKLKRVAAERDRLAVQCEQVTAERDEIAVERDQIAAERDRLMEEHEKKLTRLSTEGEALRARLLKVEQAEFELRSLLAQVTAALQVERQKNANPFAAFASMLGLSESDEYGERGDSGWSAAGFWAFTLGLGTLIIFAVAYAFTWAR